MRPCPGLSPCLPRIAATPRRSDIRHRPPSSRLSLFTPTVGAHFGTSDSCFVFLLALLSPSRLCPSRYQASFPCPYTHISNSTTCCPNHPQACRPLRVGREPCMIKSSRTILWMRDSTAQFCSTLVRQHLQSYPLELMLCTDRHLVHEVTSPVRTPPTYRP